MEDRNIQLNESITALMYVFKNKVVVEFDNIDSDEDDYYYVSMNLDKAKEFRAKLDELINSFS